MFKLGTGRLYHAPVVNPRAILDVGTAGGIWVKEMAQVFTKARVFGCDLVEDMFNRVGMPPNAILEIGDIIQGLPYPDATFDYVHQRFLCYAIPDAAWGQVLVELFRVTRPGGWVELVESDIMLCPAPAGSQALRINAYFNTVCVRRGIQLQHLQHLEKAMAIAGFRDVRSEHRWLLPLGAWAGEGGMLLAKAHKLFLQSALALEEGEEGAFPLDHLGGYRPNSALDGAHAEMEALEGGIKSWSYCGQRPSRRNIRRAS